MKSRLSAYRFEQDRLYVAIAIVFIFIALNLTTYFFIKL